MKLEYAFWCAVVGLACGVAGSVFSNMPAAPLLFCFTISFGLVGLWLVALTKR